MEWASARTGTNAKSCGPICHKGDELYLCTEASICVRGLAQFRSLEAAGRLHLMERISGQPFRTRLLVELEDEVTSAAQDRYLFARLI
jgi:hypothetical protein